MKRKNIIRTLTLTAILGLIQLVVQAQPITGTKNIPGDYPTIANAIAQLNVLGTAAPGVTFNVASGYAESGINLLLTTTTSSATAPIVFRAAPGAAVHPKITATGGVNYSTDGIIVIAGTDWVTFDAIDLTAGDNSVEWGYGLVKHNATAPFDGCQNVVIRNCVITMNRSNAFAYGIYAGNHTATSTSSLTLTATGDALSNCKFYSNTISNVLGGISLTGYSAPSPYTLYDQNNEIGVDGGNTITNFGGGYTISAIFASGQNNLSVSNNTISSGTVTAPPSIWVAGINLGAGTAAGGNVNGNTVSLSFSGGTGQTVYGITLTYGASGSGNTLNVNNNLITNCTLSGTGNQNFYGIVNTIANSGPTTLNMNGNTVSNITVMGAGTVACLDGGTAGTINMNSNQMSSVFNSGAANLYGMKASTGTLTMHDNLLHDLSVSSGTGSIYGMYDYAYPGSETYYNNQIYNLMHGSNGSVYGMYFYTTGGTRQSYSNLVHTLSSYGGVVYGMYYGSSTPAISRNTIYDLVSYTATGQVHGLYLYNGSSVLAFNNFISDLRAPASTLTNAVNGITVYSSNPTYLHNNTIYLSATSSSTTTFGTAGIWSSTTNSVGLELKNNIVVNTSTPVYAAGPAYTTAFQRSTTVLSSYQSTSNNNLFYAGPPGPNNLVYFDGTNADPSMPLFKARVAPRESASVTELPPFVSPAGHNFHLQTGVATQVESGGLRILSPSAITTDYDGDIRWGEAGYAGSGTAPDLGADEGNFTPMAAMAFQSSTTEAITGTAYAGGVSQPVLRIRVTLSGAASPQSVTQFSLNANGTTALTDVSSAVARVFYTGNSTSFNTGIQFGTVMPAAGTFTVTGTQVLMPGDNYFWVTYDVIQTALTGHLMDGECTGITVGGTPRVPDVTAPAGSVTILGPMSGTYYVGAGNTYPNFVTLTDAMDNINHRGVSGPVTYLLTNSASTPYSAANGEVFPITAGTIPMASAVNSFTIQPAPSKAPVITGSSASSVLKLNGTDYVTINGSNTGSGSRDLTIENTNMNNWTAAVQVCSLGSTNGCYNVTVKNCIIRGAGTTNANYLTYAFSAGSTVGSYGEDNRYLTLDNNEFSRAYTGIYIAGGGYYISDNLTVTNNTVGSDVAANYAGSCGIYLSNAQGTVAGNEFKGIISASTTSRAVYVGPGTRNSMIVKNNIHNVKGVPGSGYCGVGIEVDLASAGTNITVANNLISDISGDGTNNIYSYGTAGIKLSGISTNVKVWHNTISLTGQISRSGATADISAAIFAWSSVTQIDIRNNIFINSLENNTGDAKAYGFYSYAAAAAFTALDYNDYYVSGREGVFGWINSTDITSLAGWQAATGKEASSIATDPALNPLPSVIPYPGSAALDRCPLLAVTDDYTGAARTAPVSAGAYETGDDVTPPVVTYTPFASTHLLTARTLTATIADAYAGVPTSGSGLPRLFWRVNGNPWVAVTGTWAGGNTYRFTFGNGVALGDQVNYYVVCQDTRALPNTGATPSTGAAGFSASPPACFTAPSSPSAYTITGALSGIKNVPGDYPSLTGAGGFFADMNTKSLSGDLTVKITANLTEDGTNALNEVNASDPAYRLTITNSGGYHTVSGTYSGALIRFNGTDNVTLNGKGKLMIANNQSYPSIALQLSGGCNGNTIDSCSLSCGYMIWNPGNYGIYFTGAGSNNRIRFDSVSRCYTGIYLAPSYWDQATGNTIYRNVIGSNTAANYVYNNGISVYYQDNLTISRNQVFNLIGNASPIAIYAEGTTQGLIERNDIHDIVYNGSSYGGASGITLKSLSTLPQVTVRNNIIRHIAGMGNSPNGGDYNNIPAGIKLFGSATGGIYLYYNSVYLTRDASYGLFFNNEWFTALEIGAGVSGVTMKNNLLQNSTGEDTGANITTWGYGVYTKGAASPFTSVNNNIYFSSNADNNFVGLRGTAVPPVNNMDLAGWKTFTGQDAQSLNADPLYTSVTSLVPQPASPAIGAGLPLPGIADEDFNGNARGTSTTIGAYEMVPATSKSLVISVMLQGFSTGAGTMRASRDGAGIYWGSSVADHITVELHDATPGNYSTVFYTATDVALSTAGTATLFVPAALNGSYYLTVRHRNGLSTVSASPVSFAAASVSYAFDLPAKAYGNRLVALSGGGYGIYSGDVNQDGVINSLDLTAAGTASVSFSTGYTAYDVNGDGTVDTSDLTFIDNNAAAAITSAHP